jgi:glyoxylase-like metal-dependent hydrolase (beta-lactamase superfamily II)
MHEIHVLQLGDNEVESSFLVKGWNCGVRARVPTHGFLILGNDVGPILVDTGYRDPEIMTRLGMQGVVEEGQGLEPELAQHGLTVDDIALIVHTHAHIDHTGRTDAFPMSTPVAMARREMEVAAVGGPVYPIEDVKHLLDRFHTPGAMWPLDLEASGPVHIAHGITCELAGGHTEGSLNVLVETDEGIANICGDVIYDVGNQVIEPYAESMFREPQVTGNFTLSTASEKGAIKRALESCDWLLPGHDQAVRVDCGVVFGQVEGPTVPGPVKPLSAAVTAGDVA